MPDKPDHAANSTRDYSVRKVASSSAASSNAVRSEWLELVGGTLAKWLHNPNQLADEGLDPPSTTVLVQAMSLAAMCHDETLPPPHSVTPDGSGGIVFERREDKICEKMHFWDDGSVEYIQYEGTQLVIRAPILILAR